MARLNTANPVAAHRSPKKSDSTQRTSQSIDSSTVGRTEFGARFAKGPTRKQKKESGMIFDIFPDGDHSYGSGDLEGDTSSPCISPSKQKKTRTLKTAKTNSLLLPLQHRPRQRPSIKVETDDYEKENDLTEYGTDSYSTTGSPAPPRFSPIRRNIQRTPGRSRPADVSLSHRSPEVEENEERGYSESDSLSDFIVSDNDEVSHHETSESEAEAPRKSISPPPPPSTRRRLMRGRRPNSYNEETQTEDPCSIDVKLPTYLDFPSSSQQAVQDDTCLSTKPEALSVEDDNETSSQPQTDHTPPESDLASSPLTPHTPPASTPPRSRSLIFSTKKQSRIPPTPHRQSNDAFWSQEVTNDWVDEHSPQKPKSKSPGRMMIELLEDFDDSDFDFEPTSKSTTSREISPTPIEPIGVTPKKKSTNTSAKKAEAEARKAENAERKAEKARLAEFDAVKDGLANSFISELDRIVNDGKILKMTGGIEIRWSKYLQTTAGRATYKPIYAKLPNGHSDRSRIAQHTAYIELGARIIQDVDRLVNTLAHEYCHLANYMITGMMNNPHGAEFKKWGRIVEKAMENHSKYGGKITVKTTHSYKIAFKYQWECGSCGHIFGRHSKSIDPTTKVCQCRGRLQQIKPKPRAVSPKKKSGPCEPVAQAQIDGVAGHLAQMVL